MSLRSAFDPEFLRTVQGWIESSGEAFVFIRYAYAAGAKDHLFVYSFEQFQELLKSLRPRTDVIVFRQQQLTIRGVADDALLERALKEIPDGADWMLVSYKESLLGNYDADGGDSHRELRIVFEQFRGRSVRIGLYPPWHENDNAIMQSGVVPLPDGTVKGGAY